MRLRCSQSKTETSGRNPATRSCKSVGVVQVKRQKRRNEQTLTPRHNNNGSTNAALWRDCNAFVMQTCVSTIKKMPWGFGLIHVPILARAVPSGTDAASTAEKGFPADAHGDGATVSAREASNSRGGAEDDESRKRAGGNTSPGDRVVHQSRA